MLAGIARAFVDGLAEVEPVAEQLVQEPLVDRLAALVQGAARHQLPGQQGGRSQLDKPLEDVADRSGLGLVDHQLAVDAVVPHRHEPAHPHALGAAGGELVADAFTGDLTFEQGECQQRSAEQPSELQSLMRASYADFALYNNTPYAGL